MVNGRSLTSDGFKLSRNVGLRTILAVRKSAEIKLYSWVGEMDVCIVCQVWVRGLVTGGWIILEMISIIGSVLSRHPAPAHPAALLSWLGCRRHWHCPLAENQATIFRIKYVLVEHFQHWKATSFIQQATMSCTLHCFSPFRIAGVECCSALSHRVRGNSVKLLKLLNRI